MTTDKKWSATSITVVPVDNGFVISLRGWDSTATLVAKDYDEALAILRDVDLRDGPRVRGGLMGEVGAQEAPSAGYASGGNSRDPEAVMRALTQKVRG